MQHFGCAPKTGRCSWVGKDGEVYREQLYRAGPALRIYMKATCMSTGRGNQAYGIFKFPVRHAFGLQLIELRFLRHPAITTDGRRIGLWGEGRHFRHSIRCTPANLCALPFQASTILRNVTGSNPIRGSDPANNTINSLCRPEVSCSLHLRCRIAERH